MSDEEARRRRQRNEPLPAGLVDPHPERFEREPPTDSVILNVHGQAVAEGADGYVDPVSGMFCFTAAYHWDKGECCDLGCRHCPWLDADSRI